MKILITGHCSGIGKSIYDLLSLNGHTVLGFDRDTGYDITDLTTQETILSALQDCDVFINNAFAREAQTQLLEKALLIWAKKWRNYLLLFLI